jgi:threonine/homoserine/homoserine lactone efflux protein
MPHPVIDVALAGAALGLSAGFSPGPLLSLVLSQTLTHGPREGVKVALAPLVTDTPIVLAAWLLLSRLSGSPAMLGLVALAGACLLAWYGYECFKAPPPDTDRPAEAPRSLARGVMANFTNPQPYLFWTTVGVPMLLDAAKSGPAVAILFLAVFYGAIVGAKVLAALLTGRFRRFCGSRAYRALMAGLGVSLLYYAVSFARQGYAMLRGAL